MRIVSLVLIAFVFICADVKVESKEGAGKEKSTLEILVIDASTEEPLTAVKVEIDEKTKEAYTDFEGIAKFSDIEIGLHNIEISLVSYEKQRFKGFKLDKDNKRLVVKLNP